MKEYNWPKILTWGFAAISLLASCYLSNVLHHLEDKYQALQQWENVLMHANHPMNQTIINKSMEEKLAWKSLRETTSNPRVFLSHQLQNLHLRNHEFLEKAPLDRIWGVWQTLDGAYKMRPRNWHAKASSDSQVTLEFESDWLSLNHWLMHFGTGIGGASLKSFEAIRLPSQQIALKITF